MASLKNLLHPYLSYLKIEKGLSENSIKAYKQDLLFFINYLTGRKIVSVKTLTLAGIDGFIQSRKKKGLNDRSVVREISAVKGWLRFLYNEKLLDFPCYEYIEKYKVSRYFPDYLTLREIKAMLAVNSETENKTACRNNLVIKILYAGGLRVAELKDLLIRHINFAEDYLRISGKGNKTRVVPLYPALMREIKHYIKRVRVLFRANDIDNLIVNRYGRPLSRVSLWKIVSLTAKQAGIKRKIFPHTLRHSYATHMIRNGADIRTVQELLGHASILTTEIYTHLNSDKLQKELQQHHPLYA
ncbi:MAG TPA: tyrosine-type recombinase/integrase [Spirochaetota bacterium]|nr:tyrosine-type recombinase/integrase [Spirochaetota bacterium]